MPSRAEYLGITTPNFIADYGSLRLLPGGRQVNWANVPAAYQDDRGQKVLRAGTYVVEENATGLIIPRAAGALAAGVTPLGLLTSDAHEDRAGYEAMSGYGVIIGAVVFDQLLPRRPDDTAQLDATMKTELEGRPGGGFAWEAWSDNRAS